MCAKREENGLGSEVVKTAICFLCVFIYYIINSAIQPINCLFMNNTHLCARIPVCFFFFSENVLNCMTWGKAIFNHH